jgi:steroid delta-isomerase-like uncharacterized protein
MTPEETEAVAHRWHLEVVQAGKLEVADEILAPEVVVHANGQEVRGVDAAKQLASVFPIAFPDLDITHHEAIVAGDRVAIRWTADATHRGDYFGIPPTGQRIHFEGSDFFHFQEGKIAELWIAYDNLGQMQQTGAIPAPGQASA